MNYYFNTLGIMVLCVLVVFAVFGIMLYIKNYKLKEELILLRNLMESDNRKNEVKKLKLNLKKEKVDTEKEFINKIAELKVEHAKSILEIKEEFQNRQSEDYKKAFEEGKDSLDFEIRITPLKRIIENKGVFSNKKVVEVGYSHRLYINGIPCLEQNDVITDSFKAKEINDKNVTLALENISKIIDKIPDKRAKVIGSLVDLGKSVKREAITK
ncbi:hypothetical protein [Psychroserpens mesophilus]|uniref:hypothetical protein n=1 Tax=Psychroserpens mesophilus TaxID=325473 RepID=UPI00058E8CB2|nr:hypothetical protein [Psychroserpens mesophilus]